MHTPLTSLSCFLPTEALPLVHEPLDRHEEHGDCRKTC